MIRYKSNTGLGAAYTATIIYTLYIACTVLTALAQNVGGGLQKVLVCIVRGGCVCVCVCVYNMV